MMLVIDAISVIFVAMMIVMAIFIMLMRLGRTCATATITHEWIENSSGGKESHYSFSGEYDDTLMGRTIGRFYVWVSYQDYMRTRRNRIIYKA